MFFENIESVLFEDGTKIDDDAYLLALDRGSNLFTKELILNITMFIL